MEKFKRFMDGICVVITAFVLIAAVIGIFTDTDDMNQKRFFAAGIGTAIITGIIAYAAGKDKYKKIIFGYCRIIGGFMLFGVTALLLSIAFTPGPGPMKQFSNKYLLDGFYTRMGQTEDKLVADLGKPRKISTSSNSKSYIYEGTDCETGLLQREIYNIKDNRITSATFILDDMVEEYAVTRKRQIIDALLRAGFERVQCDTVGIMRYKKNSTTLNIHHTMRRSDGLCLVIVEVLN